MKGLRIAPLETDVSVYTTENINLETLGLANQIDDICIDGLEINESFGYENASGIYCLIF